MASNIFLITDEGPKSNLRPIRLYRNHGHRWPAIPLPLYPYSPSICIHSGKGLYKVWQKSNENDFLLTMNFILFTNQDYPLQNSSIGQLHSHWGVVFIVHSSARRVKPPLPRYPPQITNGFLKTALDTRRHSLDGGGFFFCLILYVQL